MDDMELIRLLRRAEQRSRTDPVWTDPDREDDLSAPHREREKVLSLLDEREGISQRQLALLLGIRPQSLSELLLKLERDGLIHRRKNPADRREVLVSLTSEGRERSAGYESGKRRAAESFLSPLSPEERETLGALLDKLLNGTEELE